MEHLNDSGKDRLTALWAVFSFAFLFFLGVLVRYQLIGPGQRDEFVSPAFLQRRKGVPISLARGQVQDRHGIPLHYPEWCLSLALCPSEVENWDRVISILSDYLDPTALEEAGALRQASFPVKLTRNLIGSDALRIIDLDEPGIWVIPDETRYGQSSIARHVVGHIRPNAYLRPEDNVGEGGLEQEYQSLLAGGRPSWVGSVTTGDGNLLPGTGLRIAPSEGTPEDLITTLDVRIQLYVEQAMKAHGVKMGAAIVLDADTAEILAMVSCPSYDQTRPDLHLEDPEAPFVNRAISAFPPGSVWKPVVMSYALEENAAHGERTFDCTGQVELGQSNIGCGHENGHGQLTLKEALAQSCNSCFIRLGLQFDPIDLVGWAERCGFGRMTGVPLPQEGKGTLPSPHSMYAGDIANFCIGQGYITATPLQIAVFYRAIASGGVYKEPRLIRDFGDAPSERRLFSEDTANAIASGLLLATTEGTGENAWVSAFGSAGKTGTAESGVSSEPHAWFAGWAPILKPEYVVTVFVQEDGDGPSRAAPLWKDICASLLR